MVTVGLITFGLVDVAIFIYPLWFPWFAPVVIMFALAGLMSVPMLTGLVTMLQTEVADAIRGRVFAAFMFASSAAALIGAGLAGTLTDRFGVITVLTVQGAAYVVAGVVFAAAVHRRPHTSRP
jgi:predicted MFS family arabinose efflux permease